MFRGVVVASVLAVAGTFGASSAVAQERVPLDLSMALSGVSGQVIAGGEPRSVTFDVGDARRSKPSVLMPSLYATTAVMQALDVHSTLRALDRGGVEANPLMAGVTKNKAAFIALKAGVAFSSVMAARNMSKRNKVAAVLTLVAINSAYAMVINHNYRVASGGR